MKVLRDPARPRDWLQDPGDFGKSGSQEFVDLAAMDGWSSADGARYAAQRRAAEMQHSFMTEANERLRLRRSEFPRGWTDVADRGAHSATTLWAASNGSRTANLRQIGDIEQVLGGILVVTVANVVVEVPSDVQPQILVVRGTPGSTAGYIQATGRVGRSS